MAERTIRHLWYSWREPIVIDGRPLVDQAGQPVTTVKIADQGETVELSDQEIERGEALGAFEGTDSVPSAPMVDGNSRQEVEARGEAPLNLATATDDQLDGWVAGATAADVTDAAGEDPALAGRLLDAEERATDGQPRKTVEQKLTAVIARGTQGAE
jgi:hypothetical protein